MKRNFASTRMLGRGAAVDSGLAFLSVSHLKNVATTTSHASKSCLGNSIFPVAAIFAEIGIRSVSNEFDIQRGLTK
jgi:hypothetical protein